MISRLPMASGSRAARRAVPQLDLELLLFLAVLALGALLRFYRLDLAQFEEDQADLMTWTMNLIHGRGFHGVAYSIGLDQPPLPIYLFAVPAWFSSDPVWVTALIGIGDLLGVWACWRLGRLLFAPPAGLLAALLYALSPSSVVAARRIWAQSWVAPLSALALLFVAQFILTHRAGFLALGLYCAAAMMQMHPATLYYLPLLGAVAIWRRRDLRVKPLALALAAVLAGLAPYLYDELQRGLPNTRLMLDFVARPKDFDFSGLALCLELVGGGGYSVVTHLGRPLWPALHLDLAWPGLLLVALFLASLAWLVYEVSGLRSIVRGPKSKVQSPKWGRSRGLLWTLDLGLGTDRRPAVFVVLAWLASPVVFSLRHQITLHDSYLYAFYPPALVCVAGLVAELWARARPGSSHTPTVPSSHTHGVGWRGLTAWVACGALATVCLAQVADFPRFLALAGSKASRPYYGVPLRYSREAGVAALRLDPPATPAYFVTNDGRPLQYFTQGLPLRRFEGQHVLVFPPAGSDPTLYVVRDDDTPAQRELSARLPLHPETPASTGNEHPYLLFMLGGADVAAAVDTGGQAVAGSIGQVVRLRKVKLPRTVRSGEQLAVSLDWEVESDPAQLPGETTQFAHLLDSEGRGAGGDDFRGFPRFLWRPGERVRSWFRIPVAAQARSGMYTLTTGFRRSEDGRPLPALDGSGKIIGGELPVARVRVRGPDDAQPVFEHGVNAEFGSVAGLLGYTLTREAGHIDVALVWEAREPTASDYTISVQLIDAAGPLVAQDDSQPAGGALPTSFWEAGERLTDRHRLVLPAGLPSGAYSLTVSLYGPPGNQRLPVVQDGAARPDSAARLTALEVGR